MCKRRDLRVRDCGLWAGEDRVDDEATVTDEIGLVRVERGLPDDAAMREWAE